MLPLEVLVNESAHETLLKEHWKDLRPYIKQRWPEITDVELNLINGDTARLIGVLQEHYWISRSEAAYYVQEFEREHSAAVEGRASV